MFNWLRKKFRGVNDASKWGIKLVSHDDDIDKNILYIYLGSYIKAFVLPFNLIKPLIDYHVYKKDIDDTDLNDIMATAYSNNIYGVVYHKDDGYIELSWNHSGDMYKNIYEHKGFNKIMHLFWRYRTKVKTILLNIDGTSFSDITDSIDDNIEYLINLQPRYYISIADNEYNILQAECRAVLNVYTYGGNLFTKLIMMLFKKPETIRRVIIDIPEISYCITLDMKDNETILDAFRRFCNQFNYMFISIVDKG